jgi:hypothetical protein
MNCLRSVLVGLIAFFFTAFLISFVGFCFSYDSGQDIQTLSLRDGFIVYAGRETTKPVYLQRSPEVKFACLMTEKNGCSFLDARKKEVAAEGGEDSLSITVPLLPALLGELLLLFVLWIPVTARRDHLKKRGQILGGNLKNGAIVYWLLITVISIAFPFIKNTLLEFQEEEQALLLDYSHFVRLTAPRLSGAVVTVNPTKERTLWGRGLALPPISPGSLVVLQEGAHEFLSVIRAGIGGHDLAFVGAGSDATTLRFSRHGNLSSGLRFRFENLAMDCQNSPCVYFRSGGTLHLKNVVLTNYNSGAGGSNGIYAVNSTILIEDSVFDGMPGRAAKSENGGDAFDLRGANRLFVRNTIFKNNSEILRSVPAVFDRCREENSELDRASGIMLYEPPVYFRESLLTFSGEILEAPTISDDTEFRDLMLKGGDPGALTNLVRSVKRSGVELFWAALVRHSSPGIREQAVNVLTVKGYGEIIARAQSDIIPRTDAAAGIIAGLGTPLAAEAAYAKLMKKLSSKLKCSRSKKIKDQASPYAGSK